MIPWWCKTEKYRKFWRMDNGKYPYTVLFYEKDNDKYSCKDKFPLTLSDGSIIIKDEFVTIIKEAFEQLNSLNIGLEFTCVGHDVTNKDPAYNMQDDINSLVYYWNWVHGGLAGPMSKKGFGIKLDLIHKGRREWYIGCIRHEMTHVLGFGHKGSMFETSTTKMPFVVGNKIQKEFTEDTVSGLDIVYDISAKHKLYGKVNPILYKEGQAFIVKDKTNELLYQSPVDTIGYFEFRLRESLHKIRFLVVAKNKNIYNYTFLRKPIKVTSKEYEIPIKKFEYGDATSIPIIGEITKTKLVY